MRTLAITILAMATISAGTAQAAYSFKIGMRRIAGLNKQYRKSKADVRTYFKKLKDSSHWAAADHGEKSAEARQGREVRQAYANKWSPFGSFTNTLLWGSAVTAVGLAAKTLAPSFGMDVVAPENVQMARAAMVAGIPSILLLKAFHFNGKVAGIKQAVTNGMARSAEYFNKKTGEWEKVGAPPA